MSGAPPEPTPVKQRNAEAPAAASSGSAVPASATRSPQRFARSPPSGGSSGRNSPARHRASPRRSPLRGPAAAASSSSSRSDAQSWRSPSRRPLPGPRSPNHVRMSPALAGLPPPLGLSPAMAPMGSPMLGGLSPSMSPLAGPMGGETTVPTQAATAPAPVDESLKQRLRATHQELPLETPWSFYYDRKPPKNMGYKEFEKNLQRLGQFNTVEGFWRIYAYLATPDVISQDHNIFMFRHDWIPAWETFPRGGCWIIKVRKKNGLINRLWEELLFSCIGEIFEEPQIVGVVLSTRMREDVLSVWNRANDPGQEVRFRIGDKLRKILNLDPSTAVEYKHFSRALQDGSSFRNAKTYVYAAHAYMTPQYNHYRQTQQELAASYAASNSPKHGPRSPVDEMARPQLSSETEAKPAKAKKNKKAPRSPKKSPKKGPKTAPKESAPEES